CKQKRAKPENRHARWQKTPLQCCASFPLRTGLRGSGATACPSVAKMCGADLNSLCAGDSLETYSTGVLDKGTAWALSKTDIALFPNVLDRLHKLAANQERTDFQQTLYDALLIYSRNSVAITSADKLVYVLVGLESVLLRNSNEPLGKNIGERMAFLVGDSLDSRQAVVANVDEIYKSGHHLFTTAA